MKTDFLGKVRKITDVTNSLKWNKGRGLIVIISEGCYTVGFTVVSPVTFPWANTSLLSLKLASLGLTPSLGHIILAKDIVVLHTRRNNPAWSRPRQGQAQERKAWGTKFKEAPTLGLVTEKGSLWSEPENERLLKSLIGCSLPGQEQKSRTEEPWLLGPRAIEPLQSFPPLRNIYKRLYFKLCWCVKTSIIQAGLYSFFSSNFKIN